MDPPNTCFPSTVAGTASLTHEKRSAPHATQSNYSVGKAELDLVNELQQLAEGSELTAEQAQGGFHQVTQGGYFKLAEELLGAVGKQRFSGLVREYHDGSGSVLHSIADRVRCPELIHLLCEHGADIEHTNEGGQTAVFAAAAAGQLDNFSALLRENATVTHPDNRAQLPLEAALAAHHYAIVLYCIDPEFQLDLFAPPEANDQPDVEAHYYNLMRSARDRKSTQEEQLWLLRLVVHALQQKEYERSALLANALQLMATRYRAAPLFLEYLTAQMENIDRRYLFEECGIAAHTVDCNYVKVYRGSLHAIRLSLSSQLNHAVDAALMVKSLTAQYRALLGRIIGKVADTLGEPPEAAAWLCCGSMARDEMHRNSDIDSAILVGTKSEASAQYCKRLATLVTIRVINMGETAVNLYRGETHGVSGFSLDTKIHPCSAYDLIDTPEQLASKQRPTAAKAAPVLANALLSTALVWGDRNLLKRYRLAVSAELAQPTDSQKRMSVCQARAAELLRDAGREYQPNLSYAGRECEAFGLKQELYRPIQEPVAALSLLYHIDARSTIDRIAALRNKLIISPERCRVLQRAMSSIHLWRLCLHEFYKDECDIVVQPSSEPDASNFYPINAELASDIERIYRAILPFHSALREGLRNQKIIRTLLFSPAEDEPFASQELSLFTRGMLGMSAEALAAHAVIFTQSADRLADLGHLYFFGTGVEQDFKLSAELFQKAADLGHTDAQFMLAELYSNGQGVPQEPHTARQYWRQAAKAGHLWAGQRLAGETLEGSTQADKAGLAAIELQAKGGDAACQYWTGCAHRKGKGTKINPKKAVYWFKEAARRNHDLALYALGDCYKLGEGVGKNLTTAFDYYLKSAQQNYAPAQYQVGVCCEKGLGTEMSLELAADWYQKAAEQGDEDAQNDLAVAYSCGSGVAANPTLAMYWMKSAAEQDNAHSQCVLGRWHDFGTNTEKDHDRAIYWYKRSAALGNVSAFYRLGWCYKEGNGVEASASQAFHWFHCAAKQGYAYACYQLGWCYNDGSGVEASATEAFKWFHCAAEKGDAYACYQLGWCYKKGNGIEASATEAFRWFHCAAEKGDAAACYQLGWCYKKGNGIEASATKAFRWFHCAADKGHVGACCNVGWYYKIGDGVESNTQAALQYTEKAVAAGNNVARFNLGVWTFFGIGTAADQQKGLKILQQVESPEQFIQQDKEMHELADHWDLYETGVILHLGLAGQPDLPRALKYYQRALELNNPDAAGAIAVLKKAAENGDGPELSAEN